MGATKQVCGAPAAGGGRPAEAYRGADVMRDKGLCPSACGLTPPYLEREEGGRS